MENKPKKYKQISNPPSIVSEPAPIYIISKVRTGIRFSDFHKILQSGPFNLKEWAQFLHLSERTIQRYEEGKKSFEALQSERILELESLIAHGLHTMGNLAVFKQWLNTVSPVLGGVTPISLLDSAAGIHMVKDELGRIEQGIYA